MINKEAYQKAAEYIKKKSTADDFTLSIFDTDNVGTRFAENAITQHMAGQDIEIELQSVYNGQKGSASITQLDNKSLDYIIKTSENIARANKPDPEYVPSESKKDFEETLDFSETTENLTIEELIEKKKIDFYEVLDNYVVLYFTNLKKGYDKTISLDLKSEIPGNYIAPASCCYLYYNNELKSWDNSGRVLIKK